jgi:environmental stress-induced protein Ves
VDDLTAAARITVLPAHGHRRYRWRNGLGEATEIATGPRGPGPDGPAGWTLSIATVDSDVDFSRFPGLDRRLMALSAGTLGLRVDGRPVTLRRWEVAAFDGEAAVGAVGVDRPTLDLNLMMARDRFHGSLRAEAVAGRTTVQAPSGATVVVVVLDGTVALDDGIPDGRALEVHDAVLTGSGPVVLAGTGTVAVARIHPTRV